MFAWDYSIFAIVMLSFPLFLVFIVWIIYTLTKIDRIKDYTTGRLKQCPFCTHVSISLKSINILRCPCCESLYDGEAVMGNMLRRLNNKSGVVMLMVLMVVIVLMILSVSILSSSLNKNMGNKQTVDEIAAEQLAKGFFWKEYAEQTVTTDKDLTTVELNGKTFTITAPQASSTAPYEYRVTY